MQNRFVAHSTSKACMPFMDSFTSGYIQTLPCDVEFKYMGVDENGRDIIKYSFEGDDEPLNLRESYDNIKSTFPKFDGYYNVELQWMTKWEPKTTKGYSTMYYHPANRVDLPFTTFTGIIDTDKWSSTGPLGFLLKSGFEGVIKKGTPIYQMIFIKRDDWINEVSDYVSKENQKIQEDRKNGKFVNYKKNYWQKKNYS